MGRVRRGAGGFTLVELLVVVAILGVLSAVATFTVAGLFDTSNSTTCEVDAKHLTNAEDTVMAATGSYLSEPALLDEGYLNELSDRYDVQLDGTSKYSLVPTATGECSALPGAGVETTTTTTVNTAPPYVVEITKEGTDPTNADSVTWTVTFSESVTGVDAGDFIAVVGGALTGPSAIIGVTGEGASYTVTASTGIGNGTLGLNVTDNDSIVNLAGVALGGAGAGNGHATGPAFTIDTAAPSVVSVELAVASPTNAASVSWTVTFSESVTGVDIADFALVKTGLGGTSAVTNVAGGGAVYTVTASTGSGTGTLGLNVVDNDSIVDVVTNKLGGVGNGNGNFTGAVYTIDRTLPTVTGVSSSLTNGSFTIGEVVPVTVTFSEAVTVTGTPRLTLATGSPATTAVNYTSGSGSAVLTFEYTVVAGNSSADLNYSATNSLALNGGTIRDAAANNATLTLPATGAANSLAGSKAIVIDTATPVVTLTVLANNASTNDTTPTLSGGASNVLGDSATVVVTIYAGSGTAGAVVQTIPVTRTSTTWTTSAGVLADGVYTAQATQSDLAGNTGSSTANAFTIDTAAPSVVDVTSPLADSSYRIGQLVPVTVTFSEAVTVTGTPRLTLATGSPATTAVNYTSGSGTSTLTFNYTVAAGNTSADLNYSATNSLALNGGTIRDAAANNATLTLPATGAANSLGGSKAIVIDTTKPLPTALALADGPGTAGTADLGDTVTITYSEPLKVSSLCSTWTVDGANQSLADAVVTITQAANDTLTVVSPTCTFNFGSVNLGSNAWVTATRTFGATGTKSTIQWNVAAKTLTITLGTASGAVGTGVGNVIPVYTPNALITDPTLNTIVTTAFNGTSSRF